MKKRVMWSSLCLMFLATFGWSQETRPVAVSPGVDSGAAVVSQGSPTFSWSSVSWAKGYRLVVFKAAGKDTFSYSSMENTGIAVATKDIPATATSWTPSENEKLGNGDYVWYVQAVDAMGAGLWSDGRPFSVDTGLIFVAGEEAVKGRLKAQGVADKVIDEAFKGANPGARTGSILSFGVQTSVGILGTEGPSNTFYGTGAGAVTTGIQNSFFGVNAGHAHTTGAYNTFVGSNVGTNVTTASFNTFVGYAAGSSNTSAYGNAFFGYEAGYSNTTGSFNVFLGPLAGYSNTTASNNTFVGETAGNLNISGSNNSFFGEKAGYANTTGYDNSFFGQSSGFSNTTGYYNAFFGMGTGRDNTEGFRNTFIGYAAGSGNTNGNRNAFLGYYAGVNNTIGFANTFFGDATGGKNKSGYRNTFIGYGAGNSNITGNSNVCIGSYAGFYETGSNRLYIDVLDTVYPLIYGEFDNRRASIFGNLGVGLLATTYPIQVTGGAYCTGTTWVDASSRSLKENIIDLGAEEAQQAFENLSPVKFSYKTDPEKTQVGFIAEDAPSLVATKDRKGMSPMDVVAVLTKVVQEQQKTIAELRERMAKIEKKK